jgi:hypothetical protein
MSGQRTARQRVKFDEAKFFAYLKENASASLRDLFLSIDSRARVEMATYIICYLRRSEENELFLERKQRARQIRKGLKAAINRAKKLRTAYEALASINIPQVGAFGGPGSLLWPEGTPFFGDVLEAEELKLTGLLAVEKELYNDKRFGVSGNHTWLAMLEEFTAAWTKRELGIARELRPQEIAGLIEAAKVTLGWRLDRSEVDPEDIRKAINRYRANPANARFLSRGIVPYVQNRCDVVANGPYLLGIEM